MDDLLKFAIHCAKESGEIQKKYYEQRFAIHHKGEINLVTDVDYLCQAKIIELIEKDFPDDEIISEEKTNYYDNDKNRWIVDPLDGTTNYAHGYPFFCTSIAYEKDGEIVLGVVYNPVFNELFYSRKGEGAYLNGNKVKVSTIQVLKDALLSTGFPYDLVTNKTNNVSNFIKFLYAAQAIRRDGSAALNLCYLACGRFDGFWELKLNPWDVAAGFLIVLESGGKITNFQGDPFNIYRDDVAASNGLIHESMLEVLRQIEPIEPVLLV
ncbi:MAG: inositol monophosphatase family protein [Proteobacteria bacterium]|nr:inositol monophosphatase family protein [Pseudomonadota bacterium]